MISAYIGSTAPLGQGLLINEVSRSQTTTQHSRYDSSGREISSSQRALPDNRHYLQQTTMSPVGFEPTISASERPQTYTLDCSANGTGLHLLSLIYKNNVLLLLLLFQNGILLTCGQGCVCIICEISRIFHTSGYQEYVALRGVILPQYYLLMTFYLLPPNGKVLTILPCFVEH